VTAINTTSGLWDVDLSGPPICCWNICSSAKAIEVPKPRTSDHIQSLGSHERAGLSRYSPPLSAPVIAGTGGNAGYGG
jgi:hypothetical protein